MKKIFKHTLLSLALLAGAFTAQAQVKVGLNPATITPNSNLEVQADNGKKVIVNKPLGTVQVENLPAGTATDKVVVADPTGVLKQVDASTLAGSINKSVKMSGGEQNLPYQTMTTVDFTITDYDNFGGVADITGNQFIIPATGWYSYLIVQTVQPGPQSAPIPGSLAAPTVWNSYLKKKDALGVETQVAHFIHDNATGYGKTFNQANTVQFNAGDKVFYNVLPCGGCSNDSGWKIVDTSLIIKREF